MTSAPSIPPNSAGLPRCQVPFRPPARESGLDAPVKLMEQVGGPGRRFAALKSRVARHKPDGKATGRLCRAESSKE